MRPTIVRSKGRPLQHRTFAEHLRHTESVTDLSNIRIVICRRICNITGCDQVVDPHEASVVDEGLHGVLWAEH
jgi:hypothetical protein